jgi:hypothetical protein
LRCSLVTLKIGSVAADTPSVCPQSSLLGSFCFFFFLFFGVKASTNQSLVFSF